MKKRLLALMTSLALALSIVPSVFADGETTEDTTTVTTVDGFSEIMAASYYLANNAPIREATHVQSIDSWDGMIYKSLDFGEGADTIILDVKSADIYNKTGVLKFMIGSTSKELVDADGDGKADNKYGESGTLLATAKNYQTSSATAWKLHHYIIDNASLLKGVLNINLLASGAYGNVHSFQFNKAVNPYEQLLTEAITADEGKEIKSLYFDGTGAASVDLAYTGTGTLSIYQDTMNGTVMGEPITTITLDGATQNFTVDNSLYKGATDLYFTVSDDVNLTGIKFNTVKGALEEQAIVDGVTDYLVNFGEGGYNSIIFNGVTLPVADNDGLITVTVGEEELKLPVTAAGTVRLNLNDTLAALTGVQTVKISLLNAAAQSFEFAKVTDGHTEIMATTGSKIRKGSISGANMTQVKKDGDVPYMQMTRYGGITFQNIDFGEGADTYILDVRTAGKIQYGDKLTVKATTTAWDENTTWAEDSKSETYLKSGNLLASLASKPNGAYHTTWALNHYVVSNPSALKGVVNINFYVAPTASPVGWDNFRSFQFNKAVNPYAELLTESITDAKEIKSLYFDGNGAQSVNFDYTVTEGAESATIAVYNDTVNGTTNMTAIDTFDLDLDATTKTIKIDAAKYQGVKDLYFVVSGATVSGIAFEELKIVDPFDGDEEISALYVADAETAEAVKNEFEGALAYFEKTYTDTYVDLSEKSDVEYLDFLKNIPTADIVFVQASSKAEAILTELAKLETKPIVIVVGTADYAADYGVSAVSIGEGTFELPETYKKPTALTTRPAYEEIKAISYDDNYVAAQEGTYDRVNNFNGTGQYIMFKNVDFTNGIKNVTFNYASGVDYKTGKLEVRIGSKTGTLLATSSACTNTQSWGAPGELDTVNVEQSLYGVHDVYVVSNGNVAYGNLISIRFTQDDSIDAKAGLSTSNGVASENLKVVDGTYYAMSEADSVTYANVDFGETARNYYVDVEVAVSADAQGSVYIEENEDTFVKYDLSEAGQNFTKLSVMTNSPVSGLKNLRVRYAGSGTAYLKSITFRDVLSYKDVLGVSNYSIDDTTAILNTNRFEKMDQDDAYVVWKDVDFTGSEDKILTMKAQIGVADGYDGGYLTVRADSANGPIIARTPVVHQTGMGWAVPEYYLKAPVIADLTGTHDLYVSIDNAPVMERNKAGNIFSIEFIENTEDTFVSNYYVDMEDPEDDGSWIKQDMNSAVRFKNADADLKKFVLVTAVYGANGLVGIDYNVCDAVVGTNTALSTVSAKVLEDSYTVKTFLWNAETLLPLNGEAIINENVTAE